MTSAHLRGAGLMVAAAVFFASLDAVTKSLTRGHAVIGVLFSRYLAHTLLLALAFGPRLGSRLLRSSRPGLQVLRGLCLLATSWLFVTGLSHLPLAENTAILFIYPVLVALLSGLLLGERLSLGGWIAALCGFAGVLLVVRPDAGLLDTHVGYPLAAALSQAGYLLLTRHFGGLEHPVTSNFITGLVGTAAVGIALFSAPQAIALPRPEAALALGLCALGGHYLMTLACVHVPAATLAPIAYSQLVFAAAFGAVLFQALPDRGALAGMAVIAASGIYLLRSQSSPRTP